jgi:SAM-dependent methyltransferase
MNQERWDRYLHMRDEGAKFSGDLDQGHRKYTLDDFKTWWGKIAKRYMFNKMLVVGCSDGSEVKYMTEKGFDAKGIDMDGRLFDTYPKEIRERLRVMDMHEIKLNPGSFDIIYMCHTLEHALAPYIVLCQLNKVLRMGGLAYISMPVHCDAWCADNQHINVMTELQMLHLAAKTGFELGDRRQTRLPFAKRRDASQIFVLKKVWEALE